MSTPSKYSDPTLTEKDIKVFEAKKASYFKGSIAVAVVYGVVALSLIVLAALTDAGRMMIFNNLRPLVITLAIGIIIVIIIMVLQLNDLKPVKLRTVDYDGQACPEFWTLQETPLDVLNGMTEEARIYAKTRCVRDTTVTSNRSDLVNYNDASIDQKVRDAASKYLTDTNLNTGGQMDCNTIYPVALGLTDEKAFADAPNTLRCNIASKCGFAWSAVCP